MRAASDVNSNRHSFLSNLRIAAMTSLTGILVISAAVSCGLGHGPSGSDTDRKGNLHRAAPDRDVEAAIDSFVRATVEFPREPEHINVHSIMLLKHGKVIAERWLNGAAPEVPHIMHSVSKTFVSAATGMAVAEGLLTIDDRIVDIFPDKLPESPSENLQAMTVRDLLTMTCGQSREASSVREGDDDWVEGFLAAGVEHEPGTYFAYNSLGTYVVSAILQKLSGEKVVDYLEPRLFAPLGIEKPQWEESPQGINCGGWGLWLKTEDMAKMGQLLLNGGCWNSEQLIPEDWVGEMMKKQVPTDRPYDKRADWTAGYGYFMWMCSPGGARADGSDGQYIMVLPDYDAVIVLTSDSTLYQPYVDLVWRYILPAIIQY